MSTSTIGLSPHVAAYVAHTGNGVDPILQDLIDETAQMSHGNMQVAPEQGRLLAFIIELMGASRVIEIGTFTGYSSICMARALPQNGQLICLDQSEDWANVARRYWARAGLMDKISLLVGPADQTLRQISMKSDDWSDWAGRVDFIFIDADKDGYDLYYDYAINLLRTGGVMMFDNVLWKGMVADQSNSERITCLMRKINAKAVNDSRVSTCLLPVGDGLMMARKL